MFALSPRRLRLLGAAIVLGAAPAVGVLLAWRSHGLTHRSSTLAAASHDGRRLALELAAPRARRGGAGARLHLRLARGFAFRAAGGARSALRSPWRSSAGLAGVVVKYGSPPTIARHAYHSFVSAPTERHEPQQPALLALEQRAHGALALGLEGVPGASGCRLRRGWLRALVARAPHVRLLRPGRAQPVPADARRARRRRDRAARCSSSGCRSSPPCGRAGTRSWRRRSAATSRTSRTRRSTGTGRCRP